jgi:ribosomal protein S27E
MKVNYTTADGRMTVEIDADQPKKVFADIGMFQEVFENTACGACGHTDVRFSTREVDGNTYYELRCAKCGAKLAFGSHNNDKGTLFPKRRAGKDDQSQLEEGTYLPHDGWMKWDKAQGKAV